MIQASLSGEVNHDTEPNLAVNPANVQQIAGTAFSPDPMGGSQGPVYISVNEGNNWNEPDLLPTQTLDQTIRFAGNSNRLYAGYIDTSYNMRIARKEDVTAAGLMNILFTKTEYVYDQPYIFASSVMRGSAANQDRVYVGGNDTSLNATTGKTSSIIQSMDAGIAAPVFTQVIIEKRATPAAPYPQDGPQVRMAIHIDGTIYALFYGWRTDALPPVTADVVLVRDDNWGNSASPYSALIDPDTIAGKKIAASINFNWNYLVGSQRTAGDLSVAVDPRNSSTVYVAWAELLASVYTLHLVSSTDRGVNWSVDLLTITNATHPCLAVNSQGRIGFLYQQIIGTGATQRWETHFRSSIDGVAWDDLLLCSALNAGSSGAGPLGDYAHIMAAGKNFYGIFSADNTPDLANFPPAPATVIYNRNHNYITKTLLANDGVTTVQNSVDPFFFKIEEMDPNKDFYLRDWTNTATVHDIGQEPSTYPWFYQKSDVWNRNSSTPGPIVDDWYAGDDPNAGAGAAGDNFAFARINRNDGSTAESVDVEFLSSDYGLGIPYASVGSQNINFAIGDLSKITAGQPWHLDPSASTHACLAAQLNSVDDPLILPGLSGSVPGWPYPDLLVINDNNKAQRNLHINHVVADMDGATMIRIRNAAFHLRDMVIQYEIPPIKWPVPRSRVEVIGGESKAFKSGDTIVLKNMKPGENRWISYNFGSVKAGKGTEIEINFSEINENRAVNGCSIILRSATIDDVIRSTIKLQQSVLSRLNAIKIKTDPELIKLNVRLLKSKLVKQEYLKNNSTFHKQWETIFKRLSISKNDQRINIERELKILSSASSNSMAKSLSAHTILLKKMDCLITMNLLAEGDPACILSNVNWQVSMFKSHEKLVKLKSTQNTLRLAEKFSASYSMGKAKNKDYPDLIKNSLTNLKEAAGTVKNKSNELTEVLNEIEGNMGSLRLLQNSHYKFLLLLYETYEK